MTQREFFVAVANGEITEEVKATAVELIGKLDHKNELRKGKVTKEHKESLARKSAVLEFLKENDGTFTRDDIAVALDATVGQITSACTSLVKEGLVIKSEVKVDKSKKMGYTIA